MQHIMPRQQFQSVRKAANCLQVAEATLRHRIKTGDLLAIEPGKSWPIAASDLEEFLPRHQTLKRQSARQGGHSDKANTV